MRLLTRFKRKKHQVILCGLSLHHEKIKNLLLNAGFNVIGIIDFSANIQLNKIPKNIPLVCSFIGESEKELFFKCFDFCKKNKLRFLHPVCALANIVYPKPLTPKVRIYGFPGSGNMLLRSFLSEHIPHPENSEIENFYCTVGSHFYLLMDDMLKKAMPNTFQAGTIAFDENDTQATYSPLYKDKGMFKFVKKNTGSMMIAGFPLHAFTWERVSVTHNIPHTEFLDFFNKKGYKQIVIIRHPLDTIFSFLSKIGGFGFDRAYQWTIHIAHYHAQYLQHVVRNKKNVFIIRYEDILLADSGALQQLSTYMNLNVKDEEIMAWKDNNLYKKLADVGEGHFKGGGTGKWKTYFTRETFNIFKKLGIIDLANSLGYKISETDFVKSKSHEVEKNNLPFSEMNNRWLIGYLPYWCYRNTEYQHYTTPQKLKLFYYAIGYDSSYMQQLSINSDFSYLLDSSFIKIDESSCDLREIPLPF
ncbi:sulfotransferase [Coxiella burnetii]|uniref:sulfotransferase n=1 Tax=Coxiella burnetii TaxID=777 RepID=UPI00217662AE|nr:sulfotransferase [Coxiella burnetii]